MALPTRRTNSSICRRCRDRYPASDQESVAAIAEFAGDAVPITFALTFIASGFRRLVSVEVRRFEFNCDRAALLDVSQQPTLTAQAVVHLRDPSLRMPIAMTLTRQAVGRTFRDHERARIIEVNHAVIDGMRESFGIATQAERHRAHRRVGQSFRLDR